MTVLSVNLNKIALLRNSRGRDFPSVVRYAERVIALGVRGITVHPRPDERHITRQDVRDLSAVLAQHRSVEFNIEGYPSPEFMELVIEAAPAQCTLVPDEPGQLTSDHGWQVAKHEALLTEVLAKLRSHKIRSSLFLDPVPSLVGDVKQVGADRIELYTEEFASAYGSEKEEVVLQSYAETGERARQLGLGVNAGHDLSLENLERFLSIGGIREVSIGHALIVECLELGIENVISQYLAITGS